LLNDHDLLLSLVADIAPGIELRGLLELAKGVIQPRRLRHLVDVTEVEMHARDRPLIRCRGCKRQRLKELGLRTLEVPRVTEQLTEIHARQRVVGSQDKIALIEDERLLILAGLVVVVRQIADRIAIVGVRSRGADELAWVAR
jgi:hypothetical protein